MIKFVGKRGDTLIEVMLAVGIFSMVAVAVVAVMSSGTSSAQTALETTLAREEIDAQAEALRFIQSAYIADKNAGSSGKYTDLWKEITRKAVTGEAIENVANYAPTSCGDLYGEDGEVAKYGFIIDTQNLGRLGEKDSNDNTIGVKDVLIDPSEQSQKFIEATTYPHLTFSGSDNLAITTDEIKNRTLTDAQGIYIIAVKDPGSTTIMGGTEDTQSAYYDFYIRTCWYGTGDQISSNISTVIRLYDPDAVKEISKPGYIISYYNNDGTSEYNGYSQFIKSDALATEEVTLADISGLEGWSCSAGAEIIDYEKGSKVELQKLSKCLASNSNTIKLYAVTSVEYEIQYWSNNGRIQGYTPSSFSTADDNVNITSSIPYDISNDRDFLGWSCTPNATSPTYGGETNVNSINRSGFKNFISRCSSGDHVIKLYAVWKSKTSSITVTVTWTGDDASKQPTGVFINNEKKTFGQCIRRSSSPKYQCTIPNTIVSATDRTAYYLSIDVFKYTNKPYCPLQDLLFNRCLVDILTTSGGFNGKIDVVVSGRNYSLNSSDVDTFDWQKQDQRSNYWNVLKIQGGIITYGGTFSASPDRNY